MTNRGCCGAGDVSTMLESVVGVLTGSACTCIGTVCGDTRPTGLVCSIGSSASVLKPIGAGGGKQSSKKTIFSKSTSHAQPHNPNLNLFHNCCFPSSSPNSIRHRYACKHIRYTSEGHQQEIYSLACSHDSMLIVLGLDDKTARIWGMNSRDSKVLPINDDPNVDMGVTSVAILPDACFVSAGSLNTVVRIWDVATGTLLDRLCRHSD